MPMEEAMPPPLGARDNITLTCDYALIGGGGGGDLHMRTQLYTYPTGTHPVTRYVRVHVRVHDRTQVPVIVHVNSTCRAVFVPSGTHQIYFCQL
eukprot:SAG31_NODE_25741_length_455_cov_0.870787_1_plen_93_part_10